MSVRPDFARLLLDGKKTVELRRVKPSIDKGDWVLVYATSPKKALLGAFQVANVVQAEPSELWSQLGSETGLSCDAFFEYFRDKEMAIGIQVGKAVRSNCPLSLASIRESVEDFHPPQSYAYVVPGTKAGELILGFASECLAGVSG